MVNIFNKLKEHLEEINLNLDNIVKLTVILKDISDFKKYIKSGVNILKKGIIQ